MEVVATRDIAPSPSNPTGNEGVFLVAEIATKKYYPGQQIKLNYKLVFKENVQTVNVLSEDDYADFFIQGFTADREVEYQTIKGETYASRVIKSIALFAHQSGMYTVDPMVMEVGINAPYPVNQGFFTMRRLKNIQIASEPLNIEILPLPLPAPTGFSGAVGIYSIKVTSGATQLTTDDDFSMQLEIIGDGDSRRWDPPVPDVHIDFELYEPRILEDVLHEVEGNILHTRKIDYIMIPQKMGEFDVSIPFTFFNPNTGAYETLKGDKFYLQVAQGSSIARRAMPDTLPTAPLPLRKVSQSKSDDRFWVSIPHLTLFGLLVTGTLFGLIITFRRRQEALIPKSERIRSMAARHARVQLDILTKADDIKGKPFFEKATEIYSRFLSDKFNIPLSDLDQSKLLSILTHSGLSELTIKHAVTFYEQCLTVRYGGIPGGMTKEKMIEEIRALIDKLGS